MECASTCRSKFRPGDCSIPWFGCGMLVWGILTNYNDMHNHTVSSDDTGEFEINYNDGDLECECMP